MRYWINPENQNYELSYDDLTHIGFIEVSVRPSPYSEVYQWDDTEKKWKINPTNLTEAIAARRYEVETGGVYYNNIRIDTSDRGKLMLLMAAQRSAGLPVESTINWKIGNSQYTEFTAGQIADLSVKVADFIGKCFDYEASLLERSIRADFSMDELNTGWPSSVIVL